MSHQLLLLRHGQSTWNLENKFTGWYDCPLSPQGRDEAVAAGQILKQAQLVPDVIHTSVLTRAIQTAQLAAREIFGGDVLGDNAKREDGGTDNTNGAAPVVEWRRDWRLNERHYGNLTGLDKAETARKYGDEQVHIWRRSYDVQPPPITPDNPYNPNTDPLYTDLAGAGAGKDAGAGAGVFDIPLTECLADVTQRMLPCFNEVIAPDLLAGKLVLVVAHGNSLRALVKLLDELDDAAIMDVNIPTGIPFCYELDGNLKPVRNVSLDERYLQRSR